MLKIIPFVAALALGPAAFAETPPAAAHTAAGAPAVPAPAAPRTDPLETFNRTMFGFNQAVLATVINPLSDYLGPRLPAPVITGLGNAYSNLTEIEFILNNLLTGAPLSAAVSAGRFVINSTIGIAGLFDVASLIGLQRRELDFVESLCQTGVPPGPYLVLPLVGSTNLYSAGTLASAVALEVYGLSFISSALAAADFIVIDLGGSAATLRYIDSVPVAKDQDPYHALRADHLDYVDKACHSDPGARLNAAAP
ncbi:MAG: MlaA family lipoprotein [Rhodospirillaceae bacterium]